MQNLLFLFPVLFILACKPNVDAIYYNAKIYTVNQNDSIAQAMAVRDGRVVAVGNKDVLLDLYKTKDKIDLNGKFVYPGFIDAHCHFLQYGLSTNKLNLKNTASWQGVLDSVRNYAITHPNGWIEGFGWDQNKWDSTNLPVNDELNKLFPDRPVFLINSDGRSCIVNAKALELAGITGETTIEGGSILKLKDKLTGILLGNAVDSVKQILPQPNVPEIDDALLAAQSVFFANGVTTVDNVGTTKNTVDAIKKLQKKKQLKMRVYAMLYDNDDDRNYYFKHGIYKDDRLHVCAFSYSVDGAMASRGALLLKPYTDDKSQRGIQLHPVAYFEKQAQLCSKYGFQMCVNANGDSANRIILQAYGTVLKGKNDKRWRIEHCGVIAPGDFDLFEDYSIVPSIQPTQTINEINWSFDRLGIYRLRGAYAFRILYYKNGYEAIGSNSPWGEINPLYEFYTAVSRQDKNGNPPGGFQAENGLTRQQALHAMTIWAAKANFEDDVKGSLEEGKFADFVVLDKDIMTIPYEQTVTAKVIATYVNGEEVYKQ